MNAPSSPGPFRERALERLNAPESLDRLLEEIPSRSWLPLGSLGALIVAFAAWTAFGSVPVRVDGRAVLVAPGAVIELQAPGEGWLTRVAVVVGDSVESGQVLAQFEQPELEVQLQLARRRVEDLERLERLSIAGDGVPARADDGGLDAQRRLGERLHARELAALLESRRQLTARLERARELVAARSARLTAWREMVAQGVVAREGVSEVVADDVEAHASLAEIEVALESLRAREVELKDAFVQRLERVADREQRLADARREMEQLERRLEREGRLVATRAGHVVEWTVSTGQYLRAGERLGTLTTERPSDPALGVAYFSVRDGKRITEGMPIQLTPDTVDRQRFGGIVGRVRSISAYPVSLAEAERTVGGRELAESLLAGGPRIQVVAEFERDERTISGFRWSTSRGPDFVVSPGTTATTRVTIERRAPISFVLPALKSGLGID